MAGIHPAASGYQTKWQSTGSRRRSMAGLSLGGIIVIIGIVVAIFWSLWLGIIIALVGLIFFGGFARGRWY
jgi:hypothetical protein